jgi:GNAT superfamily N-acetyltransferase
MPSGRREPVAEGRSRLSVAVAFGVSVHPQAEYMDPADLVAYREHAWSREVNRDGRQAWDALRDDVERNGFREPAFLEYNHRTGQGYLGEGNHRLGVALELGIPLPVVVHRTLKTAHAYPMKQVTEPGEYSMRDDRGFSRFPEFISPSDIGLPTIPPHRGTAIEPGPHAEAATEVRHVDARHAEREPSSAGSLPDSLEALKARHPGVEIRTSLRPEGLVLSVIRVAEHRRQGRADAALKDLVDWADRHHQVMALTAQRVGPGASNAALQRWYRRHGFVPNRGPNKNFAFREAMIRAPREIEHGADLPTATPGREVSTSRSEGASRDAGEPRRSDAAAPPERRRDRPRARAFDRAGASSDRGGLEP